MRSLPEQKRRPIGLLALLDHAGIQYPFLAVKSFAHGSSRTEQYLEGDVILSVPSWRAPKDLRGHLDYALRREPLDLGIWHLIIKALGPKPFSDWIKDIPTGGPARRAWFLYEYLTEELLDIPDASGGRYIGLANPELQLTAEPAPVSARHRVYDNLLGDKDYCPTVRLTPKLSAWIASNLKTRASAAVAELNTSDIERATSYLYHKETKASFEIEREDVSYQRMRRFIEALKLAAATRWYDEDELVSLQNGIVDPRYAEDHYRINQTYVGQTLPWGEEKVHYPCPKPEDVNGLMAGWRSCLSKTLRIDPVCQAAILGFGFVFIHPFEDGNGRLHRFVIHATLSRRHFIPSEVIIPVSAVMSRKREQYDQALEAFSKPMLKIVRYSLNAEGIMSVESDTSNYYRYWDATAQCEYLFAALSEAVDVDLPEELQMLRAYDAGRIALLNIVDMPDRKANLLMQLLIQNGYRLSKRKRELFPELMDDELDSIEQSVKDAAFPNDPAGQLNLEIN